MRLRKKPVFAQGSAVSNQDAFLLALFLAAVIHIVLVLGINFAQPKPEKLNRSIDVTLVNALARKAPNDAKYLAPEHQVGAGVQAKQPVPPRQQLPSLGSSEQKLIATPSASEKKPKTAEKVLVQKSASQQAEAAIIPDVGEQALEQRPRLNAETLHQQIAQLGTEIRLAQQGADNDKVKTVSQVSAHQFLAAQYQKDWENKVERVGNVNYPEVAAKKNFYGQLTMDVGIKADGSIERIVVTRSSGLPALDEAAKNIVKMSAPFPPFPIELMKEINVLVITRVWRFSDLSGMSTH